MSNYYLSKCCNAQVTDRDLHWVQAQSELYFHTCQKCGDNCDIYPVIDNK